MLLCCNLAKCSKQLRCDAAHQDTCELIAVCRLLKSRKKLCQGTAGTCCMRSPSGQHYDVVMHHGLLGTVGSLRHCACLRPWFALQCCACCCQAQAPGWFASTQSLCTDLDMYININTSAVAYAMYIFSADKHVVPGSTRLMRCTPCNLLLSDATLNDDRSWG